MVKKLLLLGGSYQQLVAIEYAKEAGYYTILCDYLSDNPGQYLADKFYQESTTDKETILQIATEEKIDGIIAYASEPAIPTAAYVAERLGLPTNPYSSVCLLTEKHLFRKFLRENQFSVPDFWECRCLDEDAVRRIRNMRFPIMVKPTDSSGSKGITKVENTAGIEAAVRYAKEFSRNGILEVEEYIEKDHPHTIGGDIFVINGQVVFWGFMNCLRDESSNPLVPVGKSFPSEIKEKRLELLKKETQRLVDTLHLRAGGFNIEAIITKDDKVYFIEFAARSGGNMIPDMLSMISGKNMIAAAVESSMGNYDIDISFEENDVNFASYIPHTNRCGYFAGIKYSEMAKKRIVKEVIYKNVGDAIENFEHAGKAIGIVFLRFKDREEMYQVLEHISEHVRVEVN